MHLFERKEDEKYDTILGRDLMTKLGIIMDYKKDFFAWGGIEIPMLQMGYWSSSAFTKFKKAPEENYIIVKNDVYTQPDIRYVADVQTHLKESQRNILLHVFKKRQTIFKAKRGNWLSQNVDIEPESDATPFHARAYSVPEAYKKALRKEIQG